MDNTQNQRETRGCKRRKLLVNDSADISQAQENQPNYFDTLPDEIHLEILKKIPQLKLESVGLVCCRFNRIIEDRTLWKKVVRKYSRLKPGNVRKWMKRQVQHLTLSYLTIPSLSLLPSLETTQTSWSLKEVCLSKVDICPDDLVLMFNKCKQLRKVTLAWIFVNNDLFLALSENKNLEILRLGRYFVEGLDRVVLGNLLRKLVKLQEFDYNNVIEPEEYLFVDSICENLPPSLLHFSFHPLGEPTTDQLMDSNVADIVKNCPLLRSFKVSSSGGVLTAGSTESLRNLKHLRELEITECSHIPPAAYLDMANEMESLEVLDIYDDERDDEERRALEELFGVYAIKNRGIGRVGTFNTRCGVVKIMY